MTVDPPFYLPRRWEGVIAGLAGLGVWITLAYLGQSGRGTVAGAFFGALALAIRFCTPLRKERWYRLTLAGLIAIHVALTVAFQWTFASNWTGLVVMPFMATDITLILVIIYVLYRAIHGVPSQLFEEIDPDYPESR